MSRWLLGQVESLYHWSPRALTLSVQAPVAPFQPGQFLQVGLQEGRLWRPLSLASPPANACLEFYLTLVPGGRFSSTIQQVKPGDPIWVSPRAYGHFTLAHIAPCRSLWLVATGSGMAPYLSMLAAGIQGIPQIVLAYAVRTPSELAYSVQLQRWVAAYNGRLRVQPIVSQVPVSGALQGRLPALLASGALEAAVGWPIASGQSHVMLCGHPEMVKGTQHYLENRYQWRVHSVRHPGEISTERYW